MHRAVSDTPLAILDFETTGLNAGIDRVLEVSVVRIDPGQPPQLVFDTLVNPGRPVSATWIHGITDEHVRDAPRFEDIAGALGRTLYGCVLAAYNVYFDIGFLNYELGRAGLRHSFPHLCLMYLRPMMGLGTRCSLGDACQTHGIEQTPTHSTATDTLAAAGLWNFYRKTFDELGLRTFRDLARLRSYKFVQSFGCSPLSPPAADRLKSTSRLKSRSVATVPPASSLERKDRPIVSRPSAMYDYWQALTEVIVDLEVTDAEVEYLSAKKKELGLSMDQVRTMHARVYAGFIQQCLEDKKLNDHDSRKLRNLHHCLRKLGWAPGD
jgi:DNA polymerase-3 subunit epsilon